MITMRVRCTTTARSDQAADAVFLKLYADNRLIKTETQKPAADKAYAFTVKLKAGLTKYKVQFGTKTGGAEKLVRTVANLVCGDAYLIDGQSNALALDTGEQSPSVTSEWIRSYGGPGGRGDETDWVRDRFAHGKRENLWCSPAWRGPGKAALGWWGMELAKRLLASQKMPICIIQAAEGGTRIDEHMPNVTDHGDLKTMYGHMLWRVKNARLTHGIRAVLWHQGEADQGSDGPDNGYDSDILSAILPGYVGGLETGYAQYSALLCFPDLAQWLQPGRRAWRHVARGAADLAATLLQHGRHVDAGNQAGRRLPLSAHRLVGICPSHAALDRTRLLWQSARRIHHGAEPQAGVLCQRRKDCDCPGVRSTRGLERFAGRPVLSGRRGRQGYCRRPFRERVTLKLKETSAAKTITYLKEMNWSQEKLLMGANGIAALTFCNVPIEDAKERVR